MKNDTSINILKKRIQVVYLILRFFGEAWLIERRPGNQLRSKSYLIRESSLRLLRVLGVEVENAGTSENLDRPGLIVCNHWSYLDIVVIAAHYPALFVTSVETKNDGWVGKLCEWAGCIFVERRSRNQVHQEVDQLNTVLSMGIPVVVFPEATSSDGSQILPFKGALYESAIQSQVPVHNFSLHYDLKEVAYYGDMQITPHLLALTRLAHIRCVFHYVGSMEAKRGASRRELADRSRALIAESYRPEAFA